MTKKEEKIIRALNSFVVEYEEREKSLRLYGYIESACQCRGTIVGLEKAKYFILYGK